MGQSTWGQFFTMKVLAAGVLTVACLAIGAAAEDRRVYTLDDSPVEKAKFFVASYSTTTVTSLSISTTTVPYQCFLTAATPQACTGRKLRRARKLNLDFDVGDQGLSGSQNEEGVVAQKKDNADGKFFFTVWRTSTTTATATTTSTNLSITISASAYCTFTGFTGPVC